MKRPLRYLLAASVAALPLSYVVTLSLAPFIEKRMDLEG